MSELLSRLNALRFSRGASSLQYECRDPFIESQWNQVLPFAWQTDVRPPLDLEQLLIEMDDRSENYYQALWESCTPEERVVLGQVANERLVNGKSSQTVRSLMARGLVERRPYFDVMNETFRRFVLTRPSDEDSQLNQHGTGRCRGRSCSEWAPPRPCSSAPGVSKQTIGIVTAVAATLPTLIKAVTSSAASQDQRAAARRLQRRSLPPDHVPGRRWRQCADRLENHVVPVDFSRDNARSVSKPFAVIVLARLRSFGRVCQPIRDK